MLRRFLPPLLESLEGLDAEAVVADNGSSDGSPEMLREEFEQVKCISLDSNYGFAGGYNRALKQVEGAEYIVLMNSDVEVPKGWLEPLTDWMDTHPDCGVCGPKLLQTEVRTRFEYAGAAGGLLDFFGFPYCRGRVISRLEDDHGQYDDPCETAWVSGACLMIRSSLWETLGGLDERFFMHMEEIDLCWRAQAAGSTVCMVPASRVYHLGGGSLPSSSPRKLFYNFRNNLLMLHNNLPRQQRWRIAARYILDIFAQIAYFCTLHFESAGAVAKAHRDFWKLRQKSPAGKVNLLSNSLLITQYLKNLF